MIQNFSGRTKDDAIHIRMDITVDLPAEMANELERLGIYEFESCVYEEKQKRMTASVSTALYRKGA